MTTVHIVVQHVPNLATRICSVHSDPFEADKEARRRNLKSPTMHSVETWIVEETIPEAIMWAEDILF